MCRHTSVSCFHHQSGVQLVMVWIRLYKKSCCQRCLLETGSYLRIWVPTLCPQLVLSMDSLCQTSMLLLMSVYGMCFGYLHTRTCVHTYISTTHTQSIFRILACGIFSLYFCVKCIFTAFSSALMSERNV